MLQLRSLLSARCTLVRSFSSANSWGNALGVNKNENAASESRDAFERRIFGDATDKGSSHTSFFEKLDRIEKARGKSNTSFDGQFFEDLDEGLNSLEDGLDEKLKKAAEGFDYEEMDDENYTFRPDTNFYSGEYSIQDLDLEKPAVKRFPPKNMVETSTAEVLEKADFRNVRFLAQFITEAGILIKRSKTGISAKAQRKVAREIKTARAFGLMPFITMGTKSFIPGKSMKDDDLMELDHLQEGRLDDLFDGGDLVQQKR